MSTRLKKPSKYALELQDNIIKSAKTLLKHRSLLRLALADANKNKAYRHIPGKNFQSFGKYLKFLSKKTKLSVKRMRTLAKAGVAEKRLNIADINTANMSDIALIILGYKVSKDQVVNVYHTAVQDNNLVNTTPSESQIIKAAKKLGVFEQTSRNNATNNQSSSKGRVATEQVNATLENEEDEKLNCFGVFVDNAEADDEDVDNEVCPLSQKTSKSSNVIPFNTSKKIAYDVFENLKRDDILTVYELISDFRYKLEEAGEYNPEIISATLNILKKGSLKRIQQITSRIGIKLHTSSPSQKRKRRKARINRMSV